MLPYHGSVDAMGGGGPGACVMHAVGPGIDRENDAGALPWVLGHHGRRWARCMRNACGGSGDKLKNASPAMAV